jgi:pentatricopeptide repeat protein
MHRSDMSYQQLLDILQGKQLNNSIFNNVENGTLDDTLIIDGQSMVATMDILGKAYHVPAALHLLRLAVDGVCQNRVHRNKQQSRQENLEILQHEDISDKNELRQVYRATISLLGHAHNRPSGTKHSSRLILHLLDDHMPNIAHIPPGAEIYHAAINALGKIGECDVILKLLDEMESSCEISVQDGDAKIPATANNVPPVDKMAYQTAISSLARKNYCKEAIQILHRMQSKGLTPDINTYNQLLMGVSRESGRVAGDSRIVTTDENRSASVAYETYNRPTMPWHKAALQLLQEMEAHNLRPTDQIYDSVISACTSEGEWNIAAKIREKAELQRHNGKKRKFRSVDGDDGICEDDAILIGLTTDSIESVANELHNAAVAYFDNLKAFRKCGKSSEPWWEIGRYSINCDSIDNTVSYDQPCGRSRSIIIGIQPHKNPFRNGLSLVFFDEASRVKLGRMLLRNESSRLSLRDTNQLSLVGMEVNKERRGEGLSKVFVAMWLRICLDTNTYPRAAVMNKPLISLVLMGFNFVPQNGGSRVELIRLHSGSNIENGDSDYNPHFALYSPSAKSLKGLFSQRALRLQNIAILDHPPSPPSRKNASIVYVKSEFEHPIAILENAVQYNPPSSLLDDNIFLFKDMEEHKQHSASRPCERQRNALSTQINGILKTNIEGSFESGNLEFFSDITSLKVAFLSDDMLLYSTADSTENAESHEEERVSKRLKTSCESMATV